MGTRDAYLDAFGLKRLTSRVARRSAPARVHLCSACHDRDGRGSRLRAGLRGAPVLAALVVLLFAAVALFVTDRPAGAQPEPSASINGRLVEDGKPVPGVRITVRRGGKTVGRTESDTQGTWSIPVSRSGTYEVGLDKKTIPKGFTLEDPSRTSLPHVVVQSSEQKFVVFPFGKPGPAGPSDFEQLVNLFASGVRFGLIVALAAAGLSLVFGTTGLINFAHGELVTFGALVTWYVNSKGGGPGLSLLPAAVVGVVAASAFGGVLELGLWRPLRRRRTGNIALIVVSIGLALFLRHTYLVIFKGNARSFEQYAVQRPWKLGPLSILPKDAMIIVASTAILLIVGLLLERTRAGRAVRAVTDDADLAESSGIDVKQVILLVWVASTALAGLGGVMLGTTEAVQWDMGVRILLVMFAAVILGGLGSAYGAIVGGLVVGVVSEMSAFWFATDFKIVFALGALILVLLLRPQGILGWRERVA
jgi:branched-chain amino acid transport system permease protein